MVAAVDPGLTFCGNDLVGAGGCGRLLFLTLLFLTLLFLTLLLWILWWRYWWRRWWFVVHYHPHKKGHSCRNWLRSQFFARMARSPITDLGRKIWWWKCAFWEMCSVGSAHGGKMRLVVKVAAVVAYLPSSGRSRAMMTTMAAVPVPIFGAAIRSWGRQSSLS
jgi:hypothetical protein